VQYNIAVLIIMRCKDSHIMQGAKGKKVKKNSQKLLCGVFDYF
jgi:hypothetical protein